MPCNKIIGGPLTKYASRSHVLGSEAAKGNIRDWVRMPIREPFQAKMPVRLALVLTLSASGFSLRQGLVIGRLARFCDHLTYHIISISCDACLVLALPLTHKPYPIFQSCQRFRRLSMSAIETGSKLSLLAPTEALCIATFAFCIYAVVLVVYRLYFHPLCKFPGPRLAASTLWYECYYDVILGGQYEFKIGRMHEAYGTYVLRASTCSVRRLYCQ